MSFKCGCAAFIHVDSDDLGSPPAAACGSGEGAVTGPEVHYPDAPPTGPHHTVRGVLRAVRCSYPTVLTLTVDHAGKLTSLYSNNYYKIPFSTLNYAPTGDLDPCTGIESMKASVEYIDVTGQPVAGQIVSIELSK